LIGVASFSIKKKKQPTRDFSAGTPKLPQKGEHWYTPKVIILFRPNNTTKTLGIAAKVWFGGRTMEQHNRHYQSHKVKKEWLQRTHSPVSSGEGHSKAKSFGCPSRIENC
jgi:hypothetical protein